MTSCGDTASTTTDAFFHNSHRMRAKIMRRVLFALMFLTATPAFANDASFGGSGANLMPLKNTDVAMVHERIEMVAEGNGTAWDVTVTFTFKNTSKKPVELTMGFPFPVNDLEGDVNPPAGEKPPKKNAPLVWAFTTKVRGKTVKPKRTAIDPNEKFGLYYGFAYVWPVKFKGGEEIKVVNTYRTGMTVTSVGTSHGDYVLKTGALWKGGKIGQSEIEVRGPKRHVPCFDDRYGPTTVPAGAKATTNSDGTTTFTWDLRNFAPKEDLSVCFLDLNANRHMEFYQLQDSDISKLSKKELRIVRNTVFALHGYKFKSQDLAKHFAKKPWYVVNPKFKNSDLSKEERDFVKKVSALERSK